MGLKSKLLSGNARLERCLVDNSAHVMLSDRGEHVAKIQQALQILDGSSFDQDDLIKTRYGQSTAAAVLAFKTKRKIINASYQKTPDSIVGKMTIAAMDKELLKTPPAPTPEVPLHERMFRRGVPGSSHASRGSAFIGAGGKGGFQVLNFSRGSGGYDSKPDNASHQGEVFQMVPANGGARDLWIRDPGFVKGKPSLRFELKSTTGNSDAPPSTVTMEEVNVALGAASGIRSIRLTGHAQGAAHLRAVSIATGKIVARVQVAVLNPRAFRIGFVVFEDASPEHAKGQVTQNHVTRHIATMNELWGSQANLTFESGRLATYRSLNLYGKMKAIELSALAPLMLTEGRKLVPGCDRYVFLVSEMETNLLGFTEDVIYIAQTESTESPTLSHEFGHSLGIKHDTSGGVRTNLMYKDDVDITLQFDINKPQILQANRNPGTWHDLNP